MRFKALLPWIVMQRELRAYTFTVMVSFQFGKRSTPSPPHLSYHTPVPHLSANQRGEETLSGHEINLGPLQRESQHLTHLRFTALPC